MDRPLLTAKLTTDGGDEVTITWLRDDGMPWTSPEPRSLAMLRRMKLVEDVSLAVPEKVRRQFCEPVTKGIDRGRKLMSWLAGDTNEQHIILAHCTRELAYNQFDKANFLLLSDARLRIVAESQELLAVPWHLLSVGGNPLVGAGWEISLSHGVGEMNVRLKRPLKPLLIMPHYPDDNTNVSDHILSLEQKLPGWCGLDPDVSLTIVQSIDELRLVSGVDVDGAPRRWDFIYVYGHGTVENGEPHLILIDEQRGGYRSFAVRELATLFREVEPKFIYLNCCTVGQGGWHGAGSILHHCAPVILSHHCPVHNIPARARGLRVLEQTLNGNRSPAKAFCALGDLPGAQGYEWMCGVVYERYASWEGPGRQHNREQKLRRVWELNRDQPRKDALYQTQRWLQPRDQLMRGLGFLAMGQPGDCIDHLSQQLKLQVERTGQRVHLLKLQVPPSGVRDWDGRLASAYQIQRMPTAKETLQTCLAKKERCGAGWLWIDFGTYDLRSPPEPGLRRLPFKISEWARQCSDWSKALETVRDIRLCFFLGLVDDGSKLQGRRRALSEGALADTLKGLQSDYFKRVDIDRLEVVDPVHVETLLSLLEPHLFQQTRREEISAELVRRAHARTAGGRSVYAGVIEQLQQQIRSDWSGFHEPVDQGFIDPELDLFS